ncbi:hypothetical protein Hanom_Chr12g01109871 [Helianthus anomalus]
MASMKLYVAVLLILTIVGTGVIIGEACRGTSFRFDRCDERVCNQKCKAITKDPHTLGRCVTEDTCKCIC